ncbi:MAG: hypothetical protein WC848_05205 [Parcubacteria group bacterium]|jgi:hypothetical protein
MGNDRLIGMTTGTLFKSIPAVSSDIIKIHKRLGGGAIEIGCIRKQDICGLADLDAVDIRKHFAHVSIHAPTDLRYKLNFETMSVLGHITRAHERFNFDCVVIHPDTVDDWSVLKNLSLPISVENSDWRKKSYGTVSNLEQLFEINNFGFVLDLNHCFSIDPLMRLAQLMIEKFYDRISEIHLSGFVEYHEPLFLTRQLEILNAVPEKGNIPIILEGVCEDMAAALAEVIYVKKYLNR